MATVHRLAINVLLVVLACQSIAATRHSYDNLYNSMFRFSQRNLTLDVMQSIIDHLDYFASSVDPDDPRIAEVAFWKRTSGSWTEPSDLDKCNFNEFQAIRSRAHKAKSAAEKERDEQGLQATHKIFNLDTYYQSKLKRMMSFCAALIPGLYDHLRESMKGVFKDLLELTRRIRHHYRIDPYKIGANMATLLLRKSSRGRLEQLSRSLGDIDLFKTIYEQYTPCNRLFQAVESRRGFYDLVAEARHYPLKSLSFPCPETDSGRDNMQNWAERVQVCRYISEHRIVFEIALDRIVLGDKMIKALAEVTSRAGLTNDDRYQSIFRYNSTQMNFYEVKGALSILDSESRGLAGGDPRRAEIAFWLTAATHHRDKCTKDNDALLRLNCEHSKSRADMWRSASNSATSSGAVFFNLETFVEGIRARRLEFCEDSVGAFLVNKLENIKRWTKALDIKKLAKDIHHQGPISAYLLGQRVAELIKRRNKDRKMDESLLSTKQIKNYYRLYSPCPEILKLTRRRLHRDFYELATAPGNYQRASEELKVWLDVIAVCRLIEKEPNQVFEDAATILYLHS